VLENLLAGSGLGREVINDAVDRFGTPIYLYSVSAMINRFNSLSSLLRDNLDLYYSLKANPNLGVVALFVLLGTGIEVSSGGELALARAAGSTPKRILFCGPGKTLRELESASQSEAVISVESLGELERLRGICRRLDLPADVCLRINPGTGAEAARLQMAGVTQFGMDETSAREAMALCLSDPYLNWVGFHCYMGTQILSHSQVLSNTRLGLEMMTHLARTFNVNVKLADIGGGLGVPYHDGDQAIDLPALAGGLRSLLAEALTTPWFRSCRFIMELGRYLVAEAGVYVCMVVDVKRHRERRFVVADGGINHFFPAGAIGRVVRRDFPLVAITPRQGESVSTVDVVGPLCTPLDVLGKNVALPPVEPGDLICIPRAGAYGYSASPLLWLGHPTPGEILVRDGEFFAVREPGEADDVMAGQRLPPSSFLRAAQIHSA